MKAKPVPQLLGHITVVHPISQTHNIVCRSSLNGYNTSQYYNLQASRQDCLAPYQRPNDLHHWEVHSILVVKLLSLTVNVYRSSEGHPQTINWCLAETSRRILADYDTVQV